MEQTITVRYKEWILRIAVSSVAHFFFDKYSNLAIQRIEFGIGLGRIKGKSGQQGRILATLLKHLTLKKDRLLHPARANF